MITPHGGTLVNGYAVEEQAQALKEEAQGLPQIVINPRQLSAAHMIAQGAFSPLQGFMGHEDYNSVVKDMRLAVELGNAGFHVTGFDVAVDQVDLAA